MSDPKPSGVEDGVAPFAPIHPLAMNAIASAERRA